MLSVAREDDMDPAKDDLMDRLTRIAMHYRNSAGDDMARAKRSRIRMPQRHPAEVTADRLKDHYERWYDKLAPSEQTNFETVIRALEQIAAGER